MPDFSFLFMIIFAGAAMGSFLYLVISYDNFKKIRILLSEKKACIRNISNSNDLPELQLAEIINSRCYIDHALLSDWSAQIAKILTNRKGLTPSDIWISAGNRLKAVKSRKASRSTDPYAAPEHFQTPYPDMERYSWLPDEKEDIYRIGRILSELRTLARGEAGIEFYSIVDRCLKKDSAKRYGSVRALRSALRRLEDSPFKIKWAMGARITAYAFASAAVIFPGISLMSGRSINYSTPTLVLSSNESAKLMLEHESSSGEKKWINANIEMTSTDYETARVVNGVAYGVNNGEAMLNGVYKGAAVSIKVLVKQLEPPPPGSGTALIENELVRVSQYYLNAGSISRFAGDTQALLNDAESTLDKAVFASPENMAVSADGTVYISDGEALRVIKDGTVTRLALKYTPRVIRCSGNDLYILTGPFVDENDGSRYSAIIKRSASGEEIVYKNNASLNEILDFIVSDQNVIYLLSRTRIASGTVLGKLGLSDHTIEHLYVIPDYASSMDMGSDSMIYITLAYEGEILRYDLKSGKMSLFAGNREEKAIIDGREERFYMPYRVKCHNNTLFILDSNVLRQVVVADGQPDVTFTAAGAAGPEYSREIRDTQSVESLILPFSRNADVVLLGNDILISDHKNRIIWKVPG
ncbi:MAG: hypothetical protein LBS84_06700 [Clostridiales bacterium]|jgi:hypothetical protein|nr:hypothetical protein [Clostridiales bacterium]